MARERPTTVSWVTPTEPNIAEILGQDLDSGLGRVSAGEVWRWPALTSPARGRLRKTRERAVSFVWYDEEEEEAHASKDCRIKSLPEKP